jgi:hypothetical protein
VIRYAIYRHPHSEDSELIETMETPYTISVGDTVIGDKGTSMIVKKVIVRKEGVDLYAATVLGFGDDLFG